MSATTGRTLGMGRREAVEGRFVDPPFGNARWKLRVPMSASSVRPPIWESNRHPAFARSLPDRFFNVGMAEQNLIAVSAGLAKVDRVAFCTTMEFFATRRADDFIAFACAHGNLNVKIVCRTSRTTDRVWRYAPGHRGYRSRAAYS